MIDKIKVFVGLDYKLEQDNPLKDKLLNIDSRNLIEDGENYIIKKYDTLKEQHYNNIDKDLPYSVDIKKYGAYVEYNPNLIATGGYHNFYSVNSKEVKSIGDRIEKDLFDKGIKLDLGNGDLSRIDIEQTNQMDYAIPCYNPILNVFDCNRMNKKLYDGYYGFGNKTREIVLYDKLQEIIEVYKVVPNDISNYKNLLRCELRYKNKPVINKKFKLKKLNELYNSEKFIDIKSIYHQIIKSDLFKNDNIEDLKNSLGNIDKLERNIANKKRNFTGEYLQDIGISEFLIIHKNTEQYRQLIVSLGYDSDNSYKIKKRLDKQVKEYYTIVDIDMSKLYEELYIKLCA